MLFARSLNDNIKDDEVSMDDVRNNTIKDLLRRDQLQNLWVVGIIISKWILKQ